MKSLAIFLLLATIYCVNGNALKEEKVYPHVHWISDVKYVTYKHPHPYVSIAMCSVYTKYFYDRTCERERESHMCVQACHYDAHCQKKENTEPMACCWVDCSHVCKPVAYIEMLKKENEREKMYGLHWYYRGERPPTWDEWQEILKKKKNEM